MKIKATTGLYGIIGRPVRHSLSPAMHNAAFQAMDMDAVYLAFDVEVAEKAIDAAKTLGIKGLSVTVPHKQAVMACLDEIDKTAKVIGAVNTVKNLEDGRLSGINTDWKGAMKALKAVTDIAGRKAVVLGAGGSARAVIFGLKQGGAIVHVANRTIEKAERLAAEFKCTFSNLKDIPEAGADILINTTSVGMGKMAGLSPVEPHVTGWFKVVMDIVYGRTPTRLLQDAQKQGCTIIEGYNMLLYQAVAQFEYWTGMNAPTKIMKQALFQEIRG